MPDQHYNFEGIPHIEIFEIDKHLPELLILSIIIQYSSTVYKDHKGLVFLSPKKSPQNNLTITLWHLGSIG